MEDRVPELHCFLRDVLVGLEDVVGPHQLLVLVPVLDLPEEVQLHPLAVVRELPPQLRDEAHVVGLGPHVPRDVVLGLHLGDAVRAERVDRQHDDEDEDLGE